MSWPLSETYTLTRHELEQLLATAIEDALYGLPCLSRYTATAEGNPRQASGTGAGTT